VAALDKSRLHAEKALQDLLDAAAAYEEVIKVHETNMQRTDRLITTLPEAPTSAVQQRLHDLRQLIDAHISSKDKWIYTEEPLEWQEYLLQEGTVHNTPQDKMHPAMEILLRSSTIPLWAVNQNTSKELSRAMAAFKTMEFAENDIMRYIKSSPQQEDEIK
jgi:hypothetical protein